MGYVGYTLIVASVVWVLVAQPPWIHPYLPPFLLTCRPPPALTGGDALKREAPDHDKPKNAGTESIEESDRAAVPAPPTISKITNTPAVAAPAFDISAPDADTEVEQTTPKATATPNSVAVPSFSLSADNAPANPSLSMPPPPAPTPTFSMPPPPAPSRAIPPRLNPLPSSSSFLGANSPQRARGPTPNRGPAPSSSLAPPPTHSQAPPKPSRKVLLTPGHSPLDWARISGPACDLRNLPANTPYLKVTPSMLKRQTGRKGKDAWMALGGRVYNVTPYAAYHPGGVPELMRGAGREATKLFGEVHPWVNYETMLSACLVGVLVPEEEAQKESEMDQMD
ncbi:Cytochrome b5 reductase 4 like protein [Verticillium longisporum]|uniref:Cytochrome b5 reductase 4 like protein n=1 Tax=Verticillium longisporum TaxID=100787 RepID=A0A8I2ZDF6_VERLO|nr:Cytochrome b5 reductase 4 like protein [Verticillium longisporum]